MQAMIDELAKQAAESLGQVSSKETLASFWQEYLSKNGKIPALMKNLRTVAPEERRDVGEAGFLKHPHHGGAQLAAAEHGIRARAVEQRVFDRQRDILRHIAGFAQARRQKTVDQSGLQSDRIEYGPAAVELLNQNCPFRQFYHKVPRVIIHYYYNLAPEPPISNPARKKIGRSRGKTAGERLYSVLRRRDAFPPPIFSKISRGSRWHFLKSVIF